MARKIAYDETNVIRSLSRKNSIKINSVDKSIEVVKNNTEVGNKSWGKIDYLCKIHGYVVLFVNSINKKSTKKVTINEDEQIVNTKTFKREAKLNMASMAKSAMKKVKTK